MRIIVDADSCPGRDIIEKAGKKKNIEVIMFIDVNHIIASDYARIIYKDSGYQSVDMAVANEAKIGDIVVTGDLGLSSMALSKRAYVINNEGYYIDEKNIDELMFKRHIGSELRRMGKKSNCPKKRKPEDNERLYKNLIKLIEKQNPPA
ncbi:MAG: YaiI/YqxD family protein [Clostridiaceae bacterium]